jgi:predicted alpha/beta hydrolase
VTEAIVIAELGVELRRDLREPALRLRRTDAPPVRIPIGAVVALDDPDRDKAPVDRDAEVGERVARKDRSSRPRQPS